MTSARPLRILQVSTRDVAGGAERSARNLAEEYRRLGHESWLAVGHRAHDDGHTFVIPNDERRGPVVRTLDRLRRTNDARATRIRGVGRLTGVLRQMAEPARLASRELGRDDYAFPGTAGLLELPPARPDILHLHNLHGGYFDLRQLPSLSAQVPTILNVRDGWLTSGHCAFSFGCERWKTGCGRCPDLTLFPAVKRDATAANWAQKRGIFLRSRLFVTTPSRWMMNRVDESIVAEAAVERRVIPNGVCLSSFAPGDRSEARRSLGIPTDALVLMTAANSLRDNVFKDYETLRAAIELLGARSWRRTLLVLALGAEGREETLGGVTVRFVPFERDGERLRRYYQSADLYVHAARVESFGNVLLEARACGTAVVASAVGGIPEQIRALEAAWAPRDAHTHAPAVASGALVPPADPRALAAAVADLLDDDETRRSMAAAGLQHVREEFSLDRQASRFLAWYAEILSGTKAWTARHAR